MASEPRPIESGAVEEIDFGREPAQESSLDDVPLVPERPGLHAETDYDAYARHPAAEDYATRRTRTRAVLVGFVAVLALVGVVWFAYQWGLETGYRIEVPTIKAEQEPVKSKPENPGGLVVPNQDKLVLNRASEGETEPQVERLLSAPETPQPVPRAEPPPEALAPAQPVEAAPAKPVETDAGERRASDPPAPPQAPKVAESGGGAAMGIAGSEIVAKSRERAQAPPATTPAPPEPVSQVVQPPQVAQVPATPPAAPSPEPVSRVIVADPATSGAPQGPITGGGGGGGGADVTGTQVAAITKGDFVIQLAAVGSADAAQNEWRRLQRSFPDLLGDMSLSVQEVTVKGKLYHRVQTGPFPSRATAQDMCAQIKLGNQACIVQRR